MLLNDFYIPYLRLWVYYQHLPKTDGHLYLTLLFLGQIRISNQVHRHCLQAELRAIQQDQLPVHRHCPQVEKILQQGNWRVILFSRKVSHPQLTEQLSVAHPGLFRLETPDASSIQVLPTTLFPGSILLKESSSQFAGHITQ